MTFNIQRVGLLITNDILRKWRIYLLVLAVCFTIPIFYFFNRDFSIFSLLGNNNTVIGFNPFSAQVGNSSSKFHLIWFPQLFFLTSSILVSLSFSEYQNRNSSNFHLGLPASKLEKWSAKALLSLIIIPFIIIVFYQIFIQLTVVWQPDFSLHQVKVNVIDPYLWKYIMRIMQIECLVFLGATIYKRYSIFKLFLTSIIISLIFNFIKLVGLVIINEEINLSDNVNIVSITSVNRIIDQAGYVAFSDGPSSFLYLSLTY